MQLQNLYLLVQDTDRAIKFYTEVLGLELYRRQDRYSILKLNNTWVGLLNEKFETEPVIRGNNCVPVFKVDDLDHQYSRLKELGVKFETEITTLPDVKLFQFQDSEGNILEMYQEL